MGWFFSQPPMDMARLYYADMPQIDASQAERLMSLALDSMSIPISTAIERANADGQVEITNPGLAAMSLVNLIAGRQSYPQLLCDNHREARADRRRGHRYALEWMAETLNIL